jgi:hypothetical protein
MPEAHPFTFMIRRNARLRDLYGWIIFDRQREREFSKVNYLTQCEAEEAAKVRMTELIAAWRSGRR